MSDMQDFGHRASSVRGALCQIICLPRHKKSPTGAPRTTTQSPKVLAGALAHM
jgi:hypothetical protein